MASVLPSKPQVGKGGAWEDEAAQVREWRRLKL